MNATAGGISQILGAIRPFGLTGLVVIVFASLLFYSEWKLVESERDAIRAISSQSQVVGELGYAIGFHDEQSAERSGRIERELRRIAAGQNAICINAASSTEQVERCLDAIE